MSALVSAEPRLFPVQRPGFPSYGPASREQARVREEVYMAAYEVYSHVYAPQEAMIDLEGRGCRGGFSTGELIAFLYARSFPKAEWRRRVDMCFDGGMKNL